MQDDKSMWFSERETETTTLTREELLNEINRVTTLPENPLSKILEIRYLIKRYLVVEDNEQLPNIV